MTTWGAIRIGRLTLRETTTGEESLNAQTGERALKLTGQEASPPLPAEELRGRHDSVLGLHGALVQVTFDDKTGLDGYYGVTDASAVLRNEQGEIQTSDWSISLKRFGGPGEVDIQSRLTGIKRANDFSLTGEAWHAPAIGHYAYSAGATIPSSMTRATQDGTITVYRGLAAGTNPRWGCTPADYPMGRARLLSMGLERTGTNQQLEASGWELTNALVRVTPSTAGTLVVEAWGGTAWEAKDWTISDGTAITAWDSATLVRNDYEQVILRLTREQGPNETGRVVLDIGLRRGSRLVECYLQRSTSATLSAYLTSGEAYSNTASSGYLVASSDDDDGNKATCGSARSFTAHANLGVSKASVTALDFYLAAVVDGSSAVSGDAATDLRNQYIGALPEQTMAIRR
ncbi:hypothetical protein [Microbispora rosea]|uniref:hypothetical protein n=1 Tax=Microbispora rosea TaxID=58117 RepID=UPI0004C3A273|nr:hypothetical protein [Microbispora rosea]